MIKLRRKSPDDQSQTNGNRDAVEVQDDLPQLDDQTIADRDQTAADGDQTASDTDQAAADRDQLQADADQRSSDRDQAAADEDRADHGSLDEQRQSYEASQAARLEGTLERLETGRTRALTALERLGHATSRDESAHLRDLIADARDRAAQQRDLAAVRFELQLNSHPSLASAQIARDHAATLRKRAAADREQAAADRAAAARDRQQAYDALSRAEIDQLTGAYSRGLGTVALEREINRARHGNGSLLLAYVDVDALKQLNDRHGHAAGDALLRNVVGAIQQHLRSYDPIVRVGGDEFVIALGDCMAAEARRRFHEISATLKEMSPPGSISVGYAELRPEDTLEQLTARSDTSMYEAKKAKSAVA